MLNAVWPVDRYVEGADAWTVTADDRVKYDAQFYQLQPVAGFLTGWYLELIFLL